MKSTKKHIIWNNDIGSLEDWKDGLEDADDLTDEELYQRAIELNNDYLEDEYENLIAATLDEPVVVFASLGLWYGRVESFVCLPFEDNVGVALRAIVQKCNGDPTIYVEDGDLWITDDHHDGDNYYRVRTWKTGTSARQRDELLRRYARGNEKNIEYMIEGLTDSIAPAIAKVYGWED